MYHGNVLSTFSNPSVTGEKLRNLNAKFNSHLILKAARTHNGVKSKCAKYLLIFICMCVAAHDYHLVSPRRGYNQNLPLLV